MNLVPVLTPRGVLTLRSTGDELVLDPEQGQRLERAFQRGSGCGLLWLGANEVGTALPPVLSYWREFGVHYMTALCGLAGIGEGRTKPAIPVPADKELDQMAAAVPPMIGAEYLTSTVLANLWRAIDADFDAELAESKLSLQEHLKTRHQPGTWWALHFNLAENRKDEDFPFAFLATYTTKLSAAAKAQHLPLGKAMEEYSNARNRERRLSLLMPVQRAAEHCPWLKSMVDAGEVFHPLRWSPQQAMQFLKDVPALESAGVVVRMPASWRGNRPARPQVTATVGSNLPSQLGLDALLDFRIEVTLDGEKLSAGEIKRLLAHSDGLALIRGKWVEVDQQRLGRTLEQFQAIEQRAAADGLSFGEAMRMLAGADLAADGTAGQTQVAWSHTVAGPWLLQTLTELRNPGGRAHVDLGRFLTGTLRPYQRVGVEWLYLLAHIRLGACLADDMGLGKTIQVLALLLTLKNEAGAHRRPCLLVVPTSLLANWAGEIARLCPEPQGAHSASVGGMVRDEDDEWQINSGGF